ncbi:MAG TPA: hypothetical protein PLB05_11155 [Candidatus Omnitrophota bacterium]|nr:hypothetical protein [Candidatus Omnitrophota bacterium]
MKEILAVIGALLLVMLGIFKYHDKKSAYRREQAEKAKEDLDNAKKTGDASDFIDAFDRVR